MVPDIVPGPQAYFRGDSDLPGAKINMGWQIFVKHYKLEMESHHHDTDEYLFFLGATLPDLVGSFDAEIEYFMGKEYEKHTITQATVLYIPAGVEHNPCESRESASRCCSARLSWRPTSTEFTRQAAIGNLEARQKSNNIFVIGACGTGHPFICGFFLDKQWVSTLSKRIHCIPGVMIR